MKNIAVKITALPNGPLMVEGPVEIINKDGHAELKESNVFLCRCGQSKNKPYCDSSHKTSGFQG